MREKLFRGFHPDENGTRMITLDGKKIKGEWVYGSLIELGKKKYICFADECHNIMDAGALSFEVIPETVGQFTGKLDTNGNKIFDGDVVKFEHPSGDKYTGYICYEPNEVGYVIKLTDAYYIIGYIDEFYKIIGNIHDNPELLKEVQYETIEH